PAPPAPAPAAAPTGTVTGTVLDNLSELGMAAATIQITGGPAGDQTLATELDGTFTLTLAPGTYAITFSTPDFIEATRTVTVVVGKTQRLELGLDPLPKTATGETIEIVGTIDTRKESAVLAVRRAAATVSDGVSSQEISRTPDSNAGDAMKRVVAVSVVDGKYVALRGLEGRYVTSLLNGVLLPSPEPDRNAVPLDLFPTNLLSTMTVHKSYSAELPGQFGGGTLAIATSSFPTDFEMRLGVSTSANTASTGQEGLSNAHASGFRSFLGFDDGRRALPDAIPRNQAVRGMEPGRMEQIGEAMPNVWTPTGETVTPNLSLNAMVGDSMKLAGKRVGYLATGMMRRNFSVREGQTARTQLVGGELMESERLDYQIGNAEATLGSLANVGIDLDADNQLNLLGLYTHVGEDQSQAASGFSDADASEIDVSRLSFVERELAFAQLHGTHKLSRKHGLELRWQGNYATTRRDELDSRDLLYLVDPDGGRYYRDQPGSGQHFWQSLKDTAGGGGFDVRLRLGGVQLRAGGAAALSDRALGGRRFRYKFIGSDTSVRGLAGEEMFSAEHIGPDFELEEGTLHEDAYQASLDVFGGFAMAEIPMDDKLRMVAGVRYERSQQDLRNGSRYAVAGNIASVDRSDDDVMPTANFVYAARPDMNVRAAYSYTLARPRFRELAPFLFFDYVRRRDISGNPELVTTHIHNADVRWEWFPAEDEVFAASVFGKYFRDPIEQVLANSNSNNDATFLNADGGSLVGAEVEARTTLGRLTPALSKLRVGTNISVMRSRVDLGDAQAQMLLTSKQRPLYGQSPFVVNINLGYADPKLVDVNLLYNVIGSRISDVGAEGLPDTYERPLHRLDLVAARLLRKDLRLKLSIANVLNQQVVLEQDDITVNSYAPGVSFALGLDWTP
ncbi:MAG: TonB-dependent receptor, partial [Myxococcota bacterium]|nr:TonB-dependent receptor [Myxococcota bacterium]